MGQRPLSLFGLSVRTLLLFLFISSSYSTQISLRPISPRHWIDFVTQSEEHFFGSDLEAANSSDPHFRFKNDPLGQLFFTSPFELGKDVIENSAEFWVRLISAISAEPAANENGSCNDSDTSSHTDSLFAGNDNRSPSVSQRLLSVLKSNQNDSVPLHGHLVAVHALLHCLASNSTDCISEDCLFEYISYIRKWHTPGLSESQKYGWALIHGTILCKSPRLFCAISKLFGELRLSEARLDKQISLYKTLLAVFPANRAEIVTPFSPFRQIFSQLVRCCPEPLTYSSWVEKDNLLGFEPIFEAYIRWSAILQMCYFDGWLIVLDPKRLIIFLSRTSRATHSILLEALDFVLHDNQFGSRNQDPEIYQRLRDTLDAVTLPSSNSLELPQECIRDGAWHVLEAWLQYDKTRLEVTPADVVRWLMVASRPLSLLTALSMIMALLQWDRQVLMGVIDALETGLKAKTPITGFLPSQYHLQVVLPIHRLIRDIVPGLNKNSSRVGVGASIAFSSERKTVAWNPSRRKMPYTRYHLYASAVFVSRTFALPLATLVWLCEMHVEEEEGEEAEAEAEAETALSGTSPTPKCKDLVEFADSLLCQYIWLTERDSSFVHFPIIVYG